MEFLRNRRNRNIYEVAKINEKWTKINQQYSQDPYREASEALWDPEGAMGHFLVKKVS